MRTPITTRVAGLDDAAMLAELWAPVLRRADDHDRVSDLELVVKGATASPEQRLLVAECDGTPAGAALLQATTVSAIDLEPCVQVLCAVLPQFRRRGVGGVLYECAAAFADELGITHLATAAPSAARDAHRFLARLGLGPQVTLRVAPVHLVRDRLAVQRGDDRHLPRLLAARRKARRSRAHG